MSAGPPLFEVQSTRHLRGSLLVVCGEIDLVTAPRLQAYLDDAIASDVGDLLIDLAGVSYIDSTGLHVLLAAHCELDARGRRLEVGAVSTQVGRLFEVCGVQTLLAATPTSHGAAEALPRAANEATRAG